MMKRIVTVLFLLCIIGVALMLVLPGFVDWNDHKNIIIAQIEKRLGQKIEIDGDVHFRILPNPRLLLEQVTLPGEENGDSGSLITLDRLEAEVGLEPLLNGKVEVERIEMVHPEINLAVLDDGRANWQTFFKEADKAKPAALNGSADAISIHGIKISNGTINYLNQITGVAWKIDGLNAEIAADTLYGPYRLQGDFAYNDVRVQADIGTGKYDKTVPLPLHVTLTPHEKLPTVGFNGTVDPGKTLHVNGDLTLQQGRIASLITSDDLKDIAFLQQNSNLSAGVAINDEGIHFTDLKATFEKGSALSGKVDVALDRTKKPRINAVLEGRSLKIKDTAGYISAPDDWVGHIAFKGSDIQWGDVRASRVDAAIDADADSWKISKSTVVLDGASAFTLEGVISPDKSAATFDVGLEANDISKLFPHVPFSKITLSGKLDLGSGKSSLYNFKAQPAEGGAISGVINVPADDQAPVELNLSGDYAGVSGFTLQGTATDGKFSGKLDADNIDLSKPLPAGEGQAQVNAKALAWRSLNFGATSFKATLSLKDIALDDLKTQWQSINLTGKGKIDAENVNLDMQSDALDIAPLAKLAGFENLGFEKSVLKGTVALPRAAGKGFGDVKGDINIASPQLTVAGFAPQNIAAVVKSKTNVPDGLETEITQALHDGKSVFKNISADIALDGKTAQIKGLDLDNEDAGVKINGGYALQDGKADYNAAVTLKKDDMPAFNIKTGYIVDTAPFAEYIEAHKPAPPPPPPAVAPEPAAAVPDPMPDVPAQPKSGNAAIGDILNRLDAEDTTKPAADSADKIIKPVPGGEAAANPVPPAPLIGPPQPLPALPEVNVGELGKVKGVEDPLIDPPAKPDEDKVTFGQPAQQETSTVPQPVPDETAPVPLTPQTVTPSPQDIFPLEENGAQ